MPIAYWLLTLLALLDFTVIASPWLAGHADRIVVVWTTVDTPRQAIPYAIVGSLFLPVLWYLVGLLAAVQAAVARWLLGGPTGGAALREVTRARFAWSTHTRPNAAVSSATCTTGRSPG